MVVVKSRMHELLKIAEITEKPGINFFNTCRQIIADLPVIPADPKGSDVIDSRYTSDHAYDSVRYGIMNQPRSGSPFDFGTGVPQQTYRSSDATCGY